MGISKAIYILDSSDAVSAEFIEAQDREELLGNIKADLKYMLDDNAEGEWTLQFMEDVEFGFDKPDTIVDTALEWNDSIKADLAKQMQADPSENGSAVSKLHWAAAAADNSFHPSTGYWVCDAATNIINCLLDPCALESIKSEPENIVLLRVYAMPDG